MNKTRNYKNSCSFFPVFSSDSSETGREAVLEMESSRGHGNYGLAREEPSSHHIISEPNSSEGGGNSNCEDSCKVKSENAATITSKVHNVCKKFPMQIHLLQCIFMYIAETKRESHLMFSVFFSLCYVFFVFLLLFFFFF